MKAPCGVEIKVGQKWRECDNRFNDRIVTVIEVGNNGTGDDMVRIECGNRRTWARLTRFNGKNRGYELAAGRQRG